MTYLPSLAGVAVLPAVFRAGPQTARPLPGYHHALLRGLSPLGEAERELTAASVPRGCRAVALKQAAAEHEGGR